MDTTKQEPDTVFNERTVDLLLSTAKSEYENEHNRTSIIDSKTNISLPIISAFFLAFVQLNDYKTIFELSSNKLSRLKVPSPIEISGVFKLI